jgi:hypothetical protein
MSHMLFFDHLAESLPVVTDWLRRTLSGAAAGAEATAA